MSIFIGLVSLVGYVYGSISTAGNSAVVFAFCFSVGMTMVSYFAGDQIALWSHHAVEITDKSQAPELFLLIENLSIAQGVPAPRVYVIEDASPNAFATGRDPKHASVAVTTGILQLLNKRELEGVLAHELSHIKNLDTTVMMIVAVLVGCLSLLGNSLMRGAFFGRGRRDRDSGPLAFIGILFILLSPLIGQLIKFAISRRREYLADASGALLTRFPEGLASALEKISSANIPLTTANGATNHLWISEPSGDKLAQLFSTHPPIADRIAKLRSMISHS